MTANELYQALHNLQIGEIVPDEVYMLDYANGQRPRWTVATREELGAGGVKLVLHDKQNADLFNCALIDPTYDKPALWERYRE